MDSKSYLGSFTILSNDFRRIMEFIEPVNANLHVYSHRLYELFLRICTDFESACKEKLIENGYPKNPKDMSINDYKTLESTLNLENIEVGLLFWRPKTKYIKPFANWSSSTPPLKWYKEYNSVKHNRNINFSMANMDNVCYALAGLFALFVKLDFMIEGDHHVVSGQFESSFEERFYSGNLFSIRIPI